MLRVPGDVVDGLRTKLARQPDQRLDSICPIGEKGEIVKVVLEFRGNHRRGALQNQ